MAVSSFLNRAKMSVSGTPGTGTITLNAAVSQFASFAEAGAANATVYTYVIEDGNDFEIGQGTYTSSGTTFSRDTVFLSKISGVAGTTKLNLTTNATIAITIAKEDFPNLGAKKADQQVFTSSGTWTKPSGFSSKAYALIQLWGPGGGGGRQGSAVNSHGGGGGSYAELWILLSALASTESVTIPAGGLGRTGSNGAGADGGTTTFGSKLSAFGGSGGNSTPDGIGGGPWGMGLGNGNLYDGGNFGQDATFGGGGGASGGAGNQPGRSKSASSGASNSSGVPTKASFSGGGACSTTNGTNGGDAGDGKCVVTVFDGA